jgi:cell division protein FtsB
MLKTTFIALLAFAGAAQAASPAAPPRREAVSPRHQIARLAAQRTVLEEEMGRLQLDILVTDILAERAKPRTPNPQLTMVTLAR